MKKFFLLFSLMVVSLAVVSCGSDEDEPNYANQTMVAGDTYTIPGKIKDWTSDNDLIASVSNGIVTAERVGETYIRSGAKSFKVTVNGKYNTYKEPYMQWGASKSTVKSSMSGYTLSSETSEILIYKGNYPVSLIGYSFKNDALQLSSVIIPITSVSMDELVDFMMERYVYVTKDEDNSYFGFATADKKSVVILQIETISNTLVYFISYGSANTSNAPAQTMKMMKLQIDPLSVNKSSEAKQAYKQMLDIMPEIH